MLHLFCKGSLKQKQKHELHAYGNADKNFVRKDLT